jgi:methylase of polypeptide subunit release factors
MHEVFFAGMGDKLYFAPVADELSRVLDIGTGTGIWAIQLGSYFVRLLGLAKSG